LPRAPRSWMLEGTLLESTLLAPVRYHHTALDGARLGPATRPSLDAWFSGAAGRLRPGDTLLLFVTDHGQEGNRPGDGRIVLWNRQTLSVGELSALLARLPPAVR